MPRAGHWAGHGRRPHTAVLMSASGWAGLCCTGGSIETGLTTRPRAVILTPVCLEFLGERTPWVWHPASPLCLLTGSPLHKGPRAQRPSAVPLRALEGTRPTCHQGSQAEEHPRQPGEEPSGPWGSPGEGSRFLSKDSLYPPGAWVEVVTYESEQVPSRDAW